MTADTAADTDVVDDRGRTELRERAVAKIVVAAASEVDDVASPVTRVLGQALGSADPDGRPTADVRLDGDLVTAEVRLSVRWPVPVTDAADRVRSRIRERLDELAGLRVGHVDITVTDLPTDGRTRPRVA